MFFARHFSGVCNPGLLTTLEKVSAPSQWLTSVKILVAEDETNIAWQYKAALEARGHRVVLEENGQDCIDTYKLASSRHLYGKASQKKSTPFDVVILDYRMPKKDGLQVAKEILALSPKQRIVFASAYVIETLAESVKQLGQVVELLQKPFDMDSFTSAIEDRGIYEELEKINVEVSNLKKSNMTHSQLVELLAEIKNLEKEIRGQ